MSRNYRIEHRDYRPDIDGLRALAIMSVLFFHAFPKFLPGGFVGVDIFFVISGYLISKHIFEHLDLKVFSYKYFYIRRIKRIFPAVILVLVASILFGWVMLSPGEYKELGRQIAASASFTSNYIFWKDSGYFDTASDTKPLLHLWSLSIEEQFYIVWPLIIVSLWRFSKDQQIIKAMVFLAAASLIYSISLVESNPVADFYSPLTRFWELAFGSIIALKPNLLEKRLLLKNILSYFGLGLIFYGIFILDKDRLFPGYLALIPTSGAALLILSGSGNNSGWVNKNILSIKFFVWIGLISFPLYLWHWPLLSFTRIAQSSPPSDEIVIVIVLISFLLAWLTYYFIEVPIRSSATFMPKKVIQYLLLIMVIICISGLGIKHFRGFAHRVASKYDGDVSTIILGEDRNLLKKECHITAQLENSKLKLCYSTNYGFKNRYVVMGDSKAEAFFYGIAREINFSDGLLIGSVRPPRPLEGNKKNKDLDQVAFNSVLNNHDIKVVFYVVALRDTFKINKDNGFLLNSESKEFLDDFNNWLSRYSKAINALEKTGKKVFFIMDNPTLTDPRNCISGGMTSSDTLNIIFRRKINPACSVKYTDYLAGTFGYKKFVNELVRNNPNLIVYDTSRVLCDVDNNVCNIKSQDGKFFYSYSDHISDYANTKIANDLKLILKSLL